MVNMTINIDTSINEDCFEGLKMTMHMLTFINEHCRDGGEYDHGHARHHEDSAHLPRAHVVLLSNNIYMITVSCIYYI